MRRIALVGILMIGAIGLAIPALVQKSNAQDYAINTRCFLTLRDGRQVAMPNATSNPSCVRAGQACSLGRPYSGISWQTNVVAIVNGEFCANSGNEPLDVPGGERTGGGDPRPPGDEIADYSVPTAREAPSPDGARFTRVYHAPRKKSGAYETSSVDYQLCSPKAPANYRILSHSFSLTGDRNCEAYASCRLHQETAEQVCYRYSMQGHSECRREFNCQDSGRRYSTGQLRVTFEPVGDTRTAQPVEIGSCVGHGGVQGVRFWGPVGETCNGVQAWGTYQGGRSVTQLGSCRGHGGVEGVQLFGPVGEPCAGIGGGWGVYGSPQDVTSRGIASCMGHGDILRGMRLWGPTGQPCGGMSASVWGRYSE
jgi:hypothetical protein